MTRINDGELAGIRKRVEEDRGCFQASDRFQLLAEVDRLRSGLRLAAEWDAAHDKHNLALAAGYQGRIKHYEAKLDEAHEAFRAWLDEGEKG